MTPQERERLIEEQKRLLEQLRDAERAAPDFNVVETVSEKGKVVSESAALNPGDRIMRVQRIASRLQEIESLLKE